MKKFIELKEAKIPFKDAFYVSSYEEKGFYSVKTEDAKYFVFVTDNYNEQFLNNLEGVFFAKKLYFSLR